MTEAIGLGVLNIVLVLFFGPLFEGFVRKYIKANIAHSRRGPLVGVWQPFIDLFKLLGKEDLEAAGGVVTLQRLAPMMALAAALTASLFIPIAGKAPFEMHGDLIVFVYIIGISAVFIVFGAMASGSPYSYVGGTREMTLYLIVEPVLFIALVAAMINAHSLRFHDLIAWHQTHGVSLSMLVGAFALLMAMQAQFGKLPFDIAEAEQEIIGGPFIEMSGPKLALLKWTMFSRQFVFASVLVTVFFPWGKTGILAIDALITLIKVFVAYVVVGLIEVLTPRLRIDQALRFYLAMIITSAIAVVLAYVSP